MEELPPSQIIVSENYVSIAYQEMSEYITKDGYPLLSKPVTFLPGLIIVIIGWVVKLFILPFYPIGWLNYIGRVALFRGVILWIESVNNELERSNNIVGASY